MTPFHSILAATDFSIDGRNAGRRAALLAREHDVPLKLVHVLRPGSRLSWRHGVMRSSDIDLQVAQARESLRSVALDIAGRYDVTARLEVIVGEPIEVLRQASEHAALLVLGWRAHGRFKVWPVGGAVDRWLGTCRQPLLVVRTSVEGAYRRVLVPVDFTASSGAAVLFAARLARGGSLHAFHAIHAHREAVLRDAEVPEHVIRQSRLRQEAGTIACMRRMVVQFGLDSRRVGFSVAHGHPAYSTLFHAQRLGADLIVAGREDRTTLGELLFGSVSRRVLAGSRCDMLIVPQASSRTRADSAAPARADTAALARGAAALAGASTPGSWMETGERSLSRRPA